jgi:hypothetical protein
MKNNRSMKCIVLLAALAGCVFSSQALVSMWVGGDGQYTTAGNWSPVGVPNLSAAGNTARITSGNVTYTPGGDLAINNGSTLQISGGSFVQAGGIAWMQFQGGNLLVDGGTFDQGTAGNLLRDANSTVTCSAGTLNWTGNLIYDTASTGELIISGSGSIVTTGEFKPIEAFTMTGGKLVCNLISFADGPGGITLSGGRIEVNGAAAFNGLYGAELTKNINFTAGSKGSIFFNSFTLAQLTTAGLLTNGAITLEGAVDATAFSVVEENGGVRVILVPTEPIIGLGVFSR